MGFLLVGERTADLATGARLAAAATIVAGIAGPAGGRWLDRSDLRRGLQIACLSAAACLVILTIICVMGWPTGIMLPVVILYGLTIAPIAGATRAVLVISVPRREMDQAGAVEPVINEAAFIAGPATAGLAAIVGGPAAVLGVMAFLAATACIVIRKLPSRQPGESLAPRVSWSWRDVALIYGAVFVAAASLGLLTAALPGRFTEIGSSAGLGGALLSLTAVGSLVGGLATPTPPKRANEARLRGALLLAVLAAVLLPLAGLTSVLLIGLLLPLVGTPIAPLYALGTAALQQRVPISRQVEAFSRYASAIMLGTGAGQALVGVAVGLVGYSALLLASALTCFSLAVAVPLAGGRGRG